METLEHLKKSINEHLVPGFNAGINNAIEEFQKGIENAETRIIESEVHYAALIAEAMEFVKTYPDESIAALVNDPASDTAQAFDVIIGREIGERVAPLVADYIGTAPAIVDAAAAAVNANPAIADLQAAKWKRGDVGVAVDINTLNTSGYRGILFGNGANQPVPYTGTVETRTLGTGKIDEYATWERVPRPFIRSDFGGTPQPWQEIALADRPLMDWRQAYRYSSLTPAQILVIADSIGEGTGASSIEKRWINILQNYLRRHKTPGKTGAAFPFIAGRYATSVPNQPASFTGNVSGGYGWGLGWRTVRINDATGVLTYTFTGTSAKVMYVKTTLTGVMSIRVDGGPPIVVNTNGATNEAVTWETGPLAQGVHTIQIMRDASSAAGQYPYIQGVLTYDGDETSGIRVVDAAKHGVNSGQMTVANSVSTARAMSASGPYACIIIALGTNDFSAATSAIAYRDNVLRQIADARAIGGFNGSIILLNMYMGSGRDRDTWNKYGEQLSVIAAADHKVKYVDLGWNMPDIPSPFTDPAGQGMYMDTLHPSDVGHRRIAGVLANILTQ